MEVVGAVDDESYFVVEPFLVPVGQAAVDGDSDPVSVFSDRAGRFDEFVNSTTLRFGAPAIERGVGGVSAHVAGEAPRAGIP